MIQRVIKIAPLLAGVLGRIGMACFYMASQKKFHWGRTWNLKLQT